jgi:hypothetical protein
MHLHLPKAIHGWREFGKEVGIIVLGVLIALGFEQLVQMWRWHHDVIQTRDALTSEIEYSALWARERIAVQPCLKARITHLVSKLNGGSPEWTADPVVLGKPLNPIGREMQTGVPAVYRAPHRPWLSDEWETAKSSGTIDHMDLTEHRSAGCISKRRSIAAAANQLPELQSDIATTIESAGAHNGGAARLSECGAGAGVAADALDACVKSPAASSNHHRPT